LAHEHERSKDQDSSSSGDDDERHSSRDDECAHQDLLAMALQPVDRIIHRREFQCVKLVQFEAIIVRFAAGVRAERVMIMATTLVGIGRLSLPAALETPEAPDASVASGLGVSAPSTRVA
jgi:hypothetical protein